MSNTHNNPQVETITLDHREILFMRQNGPKRFASIITEALAAEGITVSRVKVHTEINTIKDTYNKQIITKARDILKNVYKAEYDPELTV